MQLKKKVPTTGFQPKGQNKKSPSLYRLHLQYLAFNLESCNHTCNDLFSTTNTFVTLPSTLILPVFAVNTISDPTFGIVTHQLSLMSQSTNVSPPAHIPALTWGPRGAGGVSVAGPHQSSQDKSQTILQAIIIIFII